MSDEANNTATAAGKQNTARRGFFRAARQYAPAIPLVVWLGVFVGLPLVYVFVLSFTTRGATGLVEYRFTLDNYMRIFDPMYLRVFGQSLGMAVVTSALTLLIGYPFAYFTAKLKRMRFIILLLVMIPFWTSSLLRTYGWLVILQTQGVLNSLLQTLGLINEPVRFMYNYGAVQLVTVYMLLPFMILPIYNVVDKLDPAIPEASRDLGATRAQTFLRVTLPLTVPGIVGGVTLVFIPAVGLFFISDLIGGAKTTLIGGLIRDQFGAARNWPFGSALSVMMILGVLLCVWVYSRLSKDSKGGLF